MSRLAKETLKFAATVALIIGAFLMWSNASAQTVIEIDGSELAARAITTAVGSANQFTTEKINESNQVIVSAVNQRFNSQDTKIASLESRLMSYQPPKVDKEYVEREQVRIAKVQSLRERQAREEAYATAGGVAGGVTGGAIAMMVARRAGLAALGTTGAVVGGIAAGAVVGAVVGGALAQ